MILSGPRVRLEPTVAEHLPRLRAIHLTDAVRRWWFTPSEAWPFDDEGVTNYTVFAGDDIAGFVQWYAEDDPHYRHAGLDLFLDASVHGQGLGTEVVRVVCAHLVDDHGFHRLIIDPEVENTTAIATYEKVGFRPVGVMRRYSRAEDGEWKDGLLMDLLAGELRRG